MANYKFAKTRFMSHTRIEPYLIDADPTSVIRIFKALAPFTDLNLNQLEDPSKLRGIIRASDYDSHEKYLLLYYLTKYLDSKNSRSLLYRKIKEIEDSEELEAAIDKRNAVEKYADEILEICDTHIREYKRKATSNLKSAIKVNFSEVGFNSELTQFAKLPYKIKIQQDSFTESVHVIFRNIFSKNIINQIIKNFFQFTFIEYPIQKLYINYTNSKEVHSAFYQLHKLYQKLKLKLNNKGRKQMIPQK